mgnify:CR=1 FL=1
MKVAVPIKHFSFFWGGGDEMRSVFLFPVFPFSRSLGVRVWFALGLGLGPREFLSPPNGFVRRGGFVWVVFFGSLILLW